MKNIFSYIKDLFKNNEIDELRTKIYLLEIKVEDINKSLTCLCNLINEYNEEFNSNLHNHEDTINVFRKNFDAINNNFEDALKLFKIYNNRIDKLEGKNFFNNRRNG